MPRLLSEKLRIQAGDILYTLHAPADFKKDLQQLPPRVSTVTSGNRYDQVHWFVQSRAQLEKELSKVMKLVKEGILVWVYYPKGTSGIQTDLTRDKGWDCLLQEDDKLSWINLISFNDTWSVFGFRAKTATDRKKDAKPKVEREIFNWVNPSTKEVRLPDDLADVLKKNKKISAFFDSLSFTNRKEYVEWIVTAKRTETRTERLNGTVERLTKGWKNPRNL